MMGREQRRRRQAASRAAHPTGGVHERPVDDLVMTRAAGGAELVLVGIAGDGYVKLSYPQAQGRALTLLELAGIDPELVAVAWALIDPAA